MLTRDLELTESLRETATPFNGTVYVYANEYAAHRHTLMLYKQTLEELSRQLAGAEQQRNADVAAPLDMLLFCPRCHAQHIDKPDEAKGWSNPPHRTHACQACGHLWRQADVFTNGVEAIKTQGAKDGNPIPWQTCSYAQLVTWADYLRTGVLRHEPSTAANVVAEQIDKLVQGLPTPADYKSDRHRLHAAVKRAYQFNSQTTHDRFIDAIVSELMGEPLPALDAKEPSP